MLRLGILGMSEGNGHPYSWSAIINGDFDRQEMAACGFAGIPVYLEANRDTLGIDGARVTHVWTQDRSLSEHIAGASMIENVVDKPEGMIGQVDAVLLARDDPENHAAMAKPFLDADVPIFIDKPLAITREDLGYFSEQNKKGKLLMSCSSMRYAGECRTAKTELASLGELQLATVVGKKDWVKYGVHMLEALFALLDDPRAVSVQHVSESGKDIVLIRFESGLLATVHLFVDIAPTFQLSLFGRSGWRLVEIRNSYSMFKENLTEFIRSVREGKSRLPFEKTENIIRTLIGARESLNRGGEVVELG
ncbi:MAG: Gfo/Idh/MocA family oxidoreductase [Calditrichaeota bacterium]|nr:Gfo/Idh/MocA family oxidoreductase [Calditrichota bacterium]